MFMMLTHGFRQPPLRAVPRRDARERFAQLHAIYERARRR